MNLSVVLNPPVHDWTYQKAGLNTPQREFFSNITTGTDGNCYLVYSTSGTSSGGTQSGSFDLVICKMSPAGSVIWSRQQSAFNTSGAELYPAIGLDAANNIYVVYLTDGTVPGGTSISPLDIVVMKMNSAGVFQWVKQNSYTSATVGNINPSIAVSPEGNVYVAYNSKGTASGGTPTGDDDIIIFKMLSDGTVEWNKQESTFNTTLYDGDPSIAIDVSQNIYVSYFTAGTTDGGTKTGPYDIVVFKLDNTGNRIWIQQQPTMNSNSENRAPSIAVSPDGRIYVAYITLGTVPGGVSSGGYDIAVFSMDTSGVLQWICQRPAMNTSAFELAVSITLDRQGFIYGTYMTDGTIPDGERVGEDANVIVFKMNPTDGSLIWILQKPFMNSDAFNGEPSIAVDAVDNVYVMFETFGALPGGTYSGGGDIAVVKLRQHPYIPAKRGDCTHELGPGTHESVRIGYVRECAESQALPLSLNWDICPQCKHPHTRVRSTPSEHDRIMREVLRCPLYYRNLDTGGLCNSVTRTIFRPATVGILAGSSHSTTAPRGVHRYRYMDRVRGIDEIAHIVRGPSASEVTARRRAAIEASARRHAEHFRKHPPPPPCRVIQQGPQAGVPIAPDSPCNIGTQRVDYSNPRA